MTFCVYSLSVLQNSAIEKAFLFDVVSKIYIATDSSPVDMQSYELCCDMIDVVIDVSCIYGWGIERDNVESFTLQLSAWNNLYFLIVVILFIADSLEIIWKTPLLNFYHYSIIGFAGWGRKRRQRRSTTKALVWSNWIMERFCIWERLINFSRSSAFWGKTTLIGKVSFENYIMNTLALNFIDPLVSLYNNPDLDVFECCAPFYWLNDKNIFFALNLLEVHRKIFAVRAFFLNFPERVDKLILAKL